jgi:hypothetical protein
VEVNTNKHFRVGKAEICVPLLLYRESSLKNSENNSGNAVSLTIAKQ